MANLPLTFALVGGGAALVWSGITDPEGGVAGAVGRVLAGKSAAGNNTKASNLPAASSAAVTLPAGVPSTYGARYAAEVVQLGDKASGYVLGGTGPDTFDCSGLLWRAAVNLGIYKGVRFTSATFALQARAHRFAYRVKGHPQAGDILLWPTHHMAISLGGDKDYAARSPSKGVGPGSYSGDVGYFRGIGATGPFVYRIGTRPSRRATHTTTRPQHSGAQP